MFKYLFLYLLLFSETVFSQEMSPANEVQKNDIINQITNSSKNTISLECKFIQEKNLSMLSEKIVSEGIMYFQKENNLRWQYNKPYPFIFILSGNKVYIKNDKRTDKFDTNSNKMFKEISEIMIGGVNGDLLLNNKKFVAEYFCNSIIAEIRLIPKDKEIKQLFSQINLSFSKTDWLVKSIEMKEPGGDNTLINFTEKYVNNKISEDLFRSN